jgi:hypothetical protein
VPGTCCTGTPFREIPLRCPGWASRTTLCRVGGARHCQGTAFVEWAATGADGEVRGHGANVLRLAADGRIAGVVGLW